MKGRKKKIIFNDVFYILKLLINFISQKQFMRVDVSIKLILFDIEIDIRDIIARLKDNFYFYFRIWKKPMIIISFNFESSITMLLSKQNNIKFVIITNFWTSSSFYFISFLKTMSPIKNVSTLSINLFLNLNILISFSIRIRFSTLTLIHRVKSISIFSIYNIFV